MIRILHKGCGGTVEEDWSVTYEYDSNEDGRKPESFPSYVCQKCKKEILGDAEAELVES